MEATKLDTLTLKENWTPEHHALYATIPAIIREFAGDLFEIKWYSHASKTEMEWEVRNNLIGNSTAYQVAKSDEFMRCYDLLTNDQKNLIYYAYEA